MRPIRTITFKKPIIRNDPSDHVFSDCFLNTPDSMASVYVSFGMLGRDISAVNQATLTCTCFGISQSSTEKEGAWQFLQFLLSEECQEIISTEFTPVRQKNFMAQCDSIYSDEDKGQFLTEIGVSKEHFISNCGQMILNGIPREFRFQQEWSWGEIGYLCAAQVYAEQQSGSGRRRRGKEK